MDVVRTLRCPGCGQLPDLVLSAHQAFCGNDGCKALMWDMTKTLQQMLAGPKSTTDLGGLGGLGAPVTRPPQVVGSATDDVREAGFRAFLHGQGAVCAPESGPCPVCAATAPPG